MSYSVKLTTVAEHQLAKLPKELGKYVVKQLFVLGEDPTLLSRPSYFPYPSKGQLFLFDFSGECGRWEINALFQYGTDEATLHILTIGFSRVDNLPEFQG